jgi:hypothetical protein
MADWRVKGTMLVACSCDYGCPCNFNTPPTTGDCEGGWTWHIEGRRDAGGGCAPQGLVFNEGWCATSTHFSVKGDVEYDHSGKNTEYAKFEYSGP